MGRVYEIKLPEPLTWSRWFLRHDEVKVITANLTRKGDNNHSALPLGRQLHDDQRTAYLYGVITKCWTPNMPLIGFGRHSVVNLGVTTDNLTVVKTVLVGYHEVIVWWNDWQLLYRPNHQKWRQVPPPKTLDLWTATVHIFRPCTMWTYGLFRGIGLTLNNCTLVGGDDVSVIE